MGFFSGLRDRVNDGSLLNSLQMAGATAKGDHATAASIGNAFEQRRFLSAQQQAEAEQARQEADAAEQQRAAIEAGLIARGIDPQQARALSGTSQGATVLGSYNNQQTPDQVDRFLAANGYTNPNQPGYAEAAASARRFALGQQVTSADGRGALAFPDIVPAPQANAVPPPPMIGSEVDLETYRNVMLQGGSGAADQMVDSGAVVRVSSPEEAMSLRPGTRWIATVNGITRTGTRP